MNTSGAIHPFGSWKSPLSPARMAGGVSFGDVAWDECGALLWLEKRTDRNAVVVHTPGLDAPRDLNDGFSARAKVGYGGGDFTARAGFACFVGSETQQVFRQPLTAGLPHPVTPAFGAAAAPALSPDGRWLLYVHSEAGADCLAVVDARGAGWPQQLVTGSDFFMQPGWHPAGDRIAWITWDHPQMPWDGTRLNTGRLLFHPGAAPVIVASAVIAGENGQAAVFQPRFSPDGQHLAYVSDAEGFWQLYLHNLETGAHRRLADDGFEYGQPAWLQGMRTYDFSPDGKMIFAVRNKEGFGSLVRITLATGDVDPVPIDSSYLWLEQPAVSPDGAQVALIASGSQMPPRVITVSPGAGVQVRARSAAEDLPPEIYPVPEPLNWKAGDGSRVHGLFYPPANPAFQGHGRPPLVVSVHGGPTSQATSGFEPRVAYLTSRGFAVLAVNYRGSTGYGRAYRQSLHGNWGVYDVDDVVSGARFLAADGRVDPDRLAVEGGSAGGLTVLLALIREPGLFKAGICRYPMVNLLSMGDSTFKFEACYLDSLVGTLPAAAKVFRDRSPLFQAGMIQDPVLLFHGEADPVVPKAQSEALVAVFRRAGVPHEFHLFPGEGHGFRKPETMGAYFEILERFLKTYLVAQ